MDVNQLKAIYFIGAGGIGMSALVRYFLSTGKKVGGYDRTPSQLTDKLVEEGAWIHYEEDSSSIPMLFLYSDKTFLHSKYFLVGKPCSEIKASTS